MKSRNPRWLCISYRARYFEKINGVWWYHVTNWTHFRLSPLAPSAGFTDSWKSVGLFPARFRWMGERCLTCLKDIVRVEVVIGANHSIAEESAWSLINEKKVKNDLREGIREGLWKRIRQMMASSEWDHIIVRTNCGLFATASHWIKTFSPSATPVILFNCNPLKLQLLRLQNQPN